MELTQLSPLIGLTTWISENWRLAFAPAVLAFLLLAYKSGLVGTMNARLDADRYRKLYKESVQREQECAAGREADRRYQADRDAYVRHQMLELQRDLDWANASVASLRSGVDPPPRPEMIPPPEPEQTSTPTTPKTISSDSLPTLAKRLFPS
jgi:hypothetical protein